MIATVERRAYRRLPALANRALLEWSDGSTTRTSAGQLINISPGGALVSVDFIPPIGQDVWLRLERPAATSWIGGRVVRINGAGSVGLRFFEDCPHDFHESAVLGIGFGNVLGIGSAGQG